MLRRDLPRHARDVLLYAPDVAPHLAAHRLRYADRPGDRACHRLDVALLVADVRVELADCAVHLRDPNRSPYRGHGP